MDERANDEIPLAVGQDKHHAHQHDEQGLAHSGNTRHQGNDGIGHEQAEPYPVVAVEQRAHQKRLDDGGTRQRQQHVGLHQHGRRLLGHEAQQEVDGQEDGSDNQQESGLLRLVGGEAKAHAYKYKV